MNTLVTTHGGLERVARAAHFFADAFHSHAPAVGHEGRRRAAQRGPVAKWISRWVDSYRARQQERAFELLMELDPRVRAEVEAAAAREGIRR